MDEPSGPGTITGMTCSAQVFTLLLSWCSAVWGNLDLCGQPHGQLRASATPALPFSLAVWDAQTDLCASQTCVTLPHVSELSLLEYNVEDPGGSENTDGWHLLSR